MDINKPKSNVRRIPDFSDKGYTIAGIVLTAIMAITGGFLIYEVLTADNLTFQAQWNIFKSPFGSLCFIIGLIIAILRWGKFGHYSSTPVLEVREADTERLIRREKNYDVAEVMLAQIFIPIIGHLVIEPIIYGCIIYYPIQCVIAVIGKFFPFILSAIVLVLIVGAWILTRRSKMRIRSVLLVLYGVLFSVAFCWGGYAIYKDSGGMDYQIYEDSYQNNEQSLTDNNAYEETTAQEQSTASETEDESEQFEGWDEVGLYGSLPEGTTECFGYMDETYIEFTITKSEDGVMAICSSAEFQQDLKLVGETMPAMGGDISFYGNEGGKNWTFSLTKGTENYIQGEALADNKSMKVMLNKKESV